MTVAQALLRVRGADKIAPDLSRILRAVRECTPLVEANTSEQSSAVIELALFLESAAAQVIQSFIQSHAVMLVIAGRGCGDWRKGQRSVNEIFGDFGKVLLLTWHFATGGEGDA